MKALKSCLNSFQLETILNTHFHVPLDKVDVWCQDEARLRQQNTTARVWATKATRPRVVRQQQFKYAYLFGAVCPSTGETEAIVAPFSNSEAMVEHMILIPKITLKWCHAVVLIDGAG